MQPSAILRCCSQWLICRQQIRPMNWIEITADKNFGRQHVADAKKTWWLMFLCWRHVWDNIFCRLTCQDASQVTSVADKSAGMNSTLCCFTQHDWTFVLFHSARQCSLCHQISHTQQLDAHHNTLRRSLDAYQLQGRKLSSNNLHNSLQIMRIISTTMHMQRKHVARYICA